MLGIGRGRPRLFPSQGLDEPDRAWRQAAGARRLPTGRGRGLSQKTTVTELTVEEKLKCASSLNRLNNAVKDMLWLFPQELRDELTIMSAKLEESVSNLIAEGPEPENDYRRVWFGKIKVVAHLGHGHSFMRDPSCELCRDEDRNTTIVE